MREKRRVEFTNAVSFEASLNSRLGSRNVSRDHLQNEADEKGPEYSLGSGTCPNASLSITNPTRIGLELNPGLRFERPANNFLSYDKAHAS